MTKIIKVRTAKNVKALNQENISSGRCRRTMTNAYCISHIPTSTGASHRCSRYERNGSRVNVISEAYVWCPSIVEIIRCDACAKAEFVNWSFCLSPPCKQLQGMKTARRHCQAVVTWCIVPRMTASAIGLSTSCCRITPDECWRTRHRWSRYQTSYILVTERIRILVDTSPYVAG